MNRRTSTFGILALVGVLLCLSLGAALARPAPSSLLTATALPLFDRMAYMPRLMRSDAPPATATSTASATANATSTASATATATATATSTATATGTATAGRCVDYVYPITLGKPYLDNNQPAWYKPVTLASVGLSADAENAQIPSLNSTNSNSPRFRIYRNPNTVGVPANYSWARWNGNESSGSSQQLGASLTGAGNLGLGFSESTPPPWDSAAIALLNGALEPGDWLAGDSGITASSDVIYALDSHIATKTRMILPAYSASYGQAYDADYKVDRFVEVRLLDYNLSVSGWLEFALIQDYKTCGATPPTTTSTTTATAAPTSTAAATITATAQPTATTSTATATSTAEPTSTETPPATTAATTLPTATATSTATATQATATVTATPQASCLDYYYPITFSKTYLENNQPYWYKPVTMEMAGLSPYAENAQIPGLNTTNPNSPRFRVWGQSSAPDGVSHFSWTRWNGAEPYGTTAQLEESLSGRGNLSAGFSEMPPPESDPNAQNKINGRLEAGDWIPGNSGVSASSGVMAALDYHIANKTLMILPVYDLTTGVGTSTGYRVNKLAKVRLLSYELGVSNAYLELALVQVVGCSSVEPPPPPPPPTATNPVTVSVTEQLQWYHPATLGGSYDIVIVQDYSYSMRFCWDTSATCASPNRRIDIAAGVLRAFVDEMLVKRNQQQGGDNRLAYVTFSQGATQRIPFMNDTNAALAAWQAQIGDLANPRIIPNSELPGNTNIASGLVGGLSYLNGARTVDSHGQPVKLVVLLLTDGIANVFNDGGYQNVSNKYTQPPFYCGETAADMDNPYVQFTCPSDAEFPNINPKPLPPIKAMVKVANDARAAKPITFYAVVVGAQNGLTPVDMHLNEVAPDNYYMANNPAELEALISAIEQDLGEPCSEQIGTPIPAAGAKVTIAYQTGGIVGIFSTNANGALVVPHLSPGTYTISIQHTGVVASQDPLQLPRNYTRMIIDGSPTPQSSITFTMPNSAFILTPVKLVIDDPANAQCPN